MYVSICCTVKDVTCLNANVKEVALRVVETFKSKKVDQKGLFHNNINFTMGHVRDFFLGLPHGIRPAAVTTNINIKMSSSRILLKHLSGIFYLNCYEKLSLLHSRIVWRAAIPADNRHSSSN